jgi:hypothetical protein
VLNWLKQAFAIDPPGPVEPTRRQTEIIERLCREIIRRRLTTPALLLLEMSRPLNYITAQAIHFFDPLVRAVTDAEGHREFANFLEQRGSIDHLVRRIEDLEAAERATAKQQ